MKLDSSIQTRMHGTAFTAVSTTATNHTKKELSQEEIISSNDTKTDKTSNISYQTSQKLEDSQLVAFKDPLNDKYVLLTLKDNTISKLKSHFGEDDFYKRDDGILRLNDKAEAYVSSWFGDIAYKRGFLEADRNNDGKLSDTEYGNTKNEFSGHGMVGMGRVDEYIDKSYVKIDEHDSRIVRYNRKDYTKPKNIDDELNTTLKINTDFNSNISLKESYSANKSNSILSVQKLIEKHVNEAIHLGILEEDLVLKLLQKATEEQLARLEALEKLKQNNGDDSKLTQDEKQLIKIEIEKSTNEDGKIDINRLEEIIKYTKTTQIYNEEEKSEKIGKYYEDKG